MESIPEETILMEKVATQLEQWIESDSDPDTSKVKHKRGYNEPMSQLYKDNTAVPIKEESLIEFDERTFEVNNVLYQKITYITTWLNGKDHVSHQPCRLIIWNLIAVF